jgi:predicted nucleotidyltransferase
MNTNSIKQVLCKYIGGSHLHGLNTPTSDIDQRGIFTVTHRDYILGTRKFEFLLKQDIQDDISLYEIRKWMDLLRRANTEAMDVLFVPMFIDAPDPIITIARLTGISYSTPKLFSDRYADMPLGNYGGP